ncbi:hypothetical protein [Burkholderia plantarii]|nr:hypothetical protein [Burkholderia plantarii]
MVDQLYRLSPLGESMLAPLAMPIAWDEQSHGEIKQARERHRERSG